MGIERIWSHDICHLPTPWTVFLSGRTLLTIERWTRLARLEWTTGNRLWEAKVRTPWGWLATSSTAAFYLNQHAWMQCFDVEHGTLFWEGRLGEDADVFGYVVPYGDYVVVGGWRGYTRLHCLDARSGAFRWQLADVGPYAVPVPGPWGIAAPRLRPPPYIASISIIAPTTGVVIRRISVPPGARASDWSSSIQRHGNALLLTTEDGTIYRLDPATDQEWQALGAHADGITTVMPTIIGQHLVFMDARGRACVYDLAAARATKSITIASEHNTRERLPAAALLSGGRIVIGTASGGRLIAIDGAGQPVDSRKIGKRICSDMTSPADDWIVAGTAGAIVACQIM